MTASLLRVALLLTLLLLPWIASAQGLPPLEPRVEAGVQMMVPQGWSVQSDPSSGAIALQESPGDPTSASVALVSGPLQPGATPEMMASQALQSVASPVVLDQRPLDANGGVFILVQGTIEGTPAKMAVVSWVDPGTQRISLALFAAPVARFDALGGAPLLFAVFGGQAGATAPQPTAGPYDQMLEYDRALWILQNAGVPSREQLVGAWSQGISVPRGGDWEDLSTGQIMHGSSGFGTALLIKPDGSYVLYYNFRATQGMCVNSVEAAEAGRWTLDGASLTLTPKEFDGDICLCGCEKPTKITDNKPVERSLTVGVHPDRPHLGATMPCAPYMISCAANGTLTLVFQK